MQPNQFSLIFDELYTEKHNLFSEKVVKWLQAKEQFLNETYKKAIDMYFTQMDTENKRFEKLIHELLKVTNAQYQILNKVKSVSQDKDLPKSKQSISLPAQHCLSPQQQQLFTSAIQKSHKKASLMHELCEFAARFFAITSTELNEFKSMHSQIQNRKERYLFDLKKEISEENKINQELCVKNEAKYFHVKNYQKLREVLERQVKILNKTHEDSRMYYKQSLEKRKEILKDCVDNMARFEELYGKIFYGKVLEEIQGCFERLIQEIIMQQQQFFKDEKQFQSSGAQTKKSLQQLHLDNIQLFKFVIQQITLGQWHHIQLQSTKKSSFTSFSSMSFTSNHVLRQQTSYQSSNIQFQVSNANNKALNLQQNNFGFVMTLTVDYKLVFRKQAEKSRVYKELVMNDVKIKADKEKKVSDLRVLAIKDKKNKEVIELTFESSNRKEEFILHLDRFGQLRKDLNK